MKRELKPYQIVIGIAALLGVLIYAYMHFSTGDVKPLLYHFPTPSDPVWYGKPKGWQPNNGAASSANASTSTLSGERAQEQQSAQGVLQSLAPGGPGGAQGSASYPGSPAGTSGR